MTRKTRWSSVVFKDTAHVIPRICPCCLKPAEIAIKTDYRDAATTTSVYSQMFYYCSDCAPGVRMYLRIRNLIFSQIIMGLIFASGLFLGIAVVEGLRIKTGSINWYLVTGASLVGTPGGCLLLLYLLDGLRIGRTTDRGIFGAAAFYNGVSYIAIRPEWLQALIGANLKSVDAETYKKFVGSPKSPKPTNRPFVG